MIFEKGRHTNYDFFIYNTPVEVVKSFKYLGVFFFYKNGNWNRTQKRLALHASLVLHNLFIIFNETELPFQQKIQLFDSLVSSILNYSSEVWGTHVAPDIELVHTKFCRKILNVKQSTNCDALFGELGRVPMYIHRKITMLKYWIKILNQHENSLLHKPYIILKNDADYELIYNGNNWAHNIEQIVIEHDLSFIWEHQTNIRIELEPIKFHIQQLYYERWYHSINNYPRLECYSLFKHSFEFEQYLNIIKVPKFRIALTRFTTSAHNLAIEQGRYTEQPRNLRICENCNQNIIENEFHFLLICSKYTHLRRQYLKRYYYTWPNEYKFINFLTETSATVINNLSKNSTMPRY